MFHGFRFLFAVLNKHQLPARDDEESSLLVQD